MSFCIKCGKEMSEGAAFCAACGTKAEDFVQAEIQEPMVNPEPVINPQPVNAVSMGYLPPAVAALKKIGSSPVSLIAIIVFTLSLLFTIFSQGNSLFASLFSNEYVRELLWELDIEIPYGLMYGYGFLGVFIKILTSIPTILITIGLWMIFATCANKKRPYVKTSGLTLIKVINIINLVFAAIGAALVVVLMLIAIIALAAEGIEEGAVVAGVLLFVAALCYTFVIIYYAKINKSLNAAKSVAATGKPNSNVSSFVGVLCFISGGFTVISTMINLVRMLSLSFGYYSYYYSFADVLSLIFSSLLGITSVILFGVLIFQYKKAMKALEMQR